MPLDDALDVDSMMTISGRIEPENFRASESIFLLKVSLRSGLKPNLMGFGVDFELVYRFSVCEETAREELVGLEDSGHRLVVVDDLCCCFSLSLFDVGDDVLAIWPLTTGCFDGEASSCVDVVEESVTELLSDAGHVVDGRGVDGCSNILNQGC